MLTHEEARAVLTDVSVRPVQEEDLPVADRILRLAFGTFLGLPDPRTFMGDADYVRTRWLATQVRYPLDGVSHFRLFRDNVRLTLMHVGLVLGMLVRLPLLLWRKAHA